MNNRSYYHEAAYFMTGFLIGYCTLYTGQELTPGRGIEKEKRILQEGFG